MRRILFMSEGVDVPASRYRIVQLLPAFERAGVRCDVLHAYGSLYNRVFSVPGLGAAYKTATRARRALATALARTDLLFLQRTAFPQSALAERIAHRRGVPMILDVDDAIFLGPGGRPSRLRERAYRDALRVADHYIAGNRWLVEVGGVPEKTTLIPTVIDTDRYVPPARRAGDDVTIGWIGTAGNFPFLERIVPSLRRVLAEAPRARVRIVSNARFSPLEGVERVEQIEWSAAAEIELLQSFDVGLMPLIDSPIARGKCAFKMIQYMAVGAPVVVSAVGANVEVLGDRDLGHALSDFDWTDALLGLVRDPERRARMGAVGREHAVREYSVAAVLPRYLEIFRGL